MQDIVTYEGKYKIIEKISTGSFSEVYKAIIQPHKKEIIYNDTHYNINIPGGIVVAIKRIICTTNIKRIVNEAKCIQSLIKHPHTVPLLFIEIEPISKQISLIFPYFEHDTFTNYFLDMNVDEIRDYMYALINTLVYLEKQHIIHRDIKPSNFLYNRKKRLYKLIDLGLSNFLYDNDKVLSTQTINNRSHNNNINCQDPHLRKRIPHVIRSGTRGFRAPEILLRCPEYQSHCIDIWSAGIILLTIMSGKYPILSGKDDFSDLAQIMRLWGVSCIEIGYVFYFYFSLSIYI